MKKFEKKYKEKEGFSAEEGSWWDDLNKSYREKTPIIYEATNGITAEMWKILEEEGWTDLSQGLSESGEVYPPGQKIWGICENHDCETDDDGPVVVIITKNAVVRCSNCKEEVDSSSLFVKS